MDQDDDILNYVYNMPSPNYQTAKFVDFILPSIERQKVDIEFAGVPHYYKPRYQNIL